MKKPSTLLQKVWHKLRPAALAPKTASARQPARKVISSLEPLEGRISPAALISPTALMYKDLDGDIVTVSFSKALFAKADKATNVADAALVFKFNTGTVDGQPFNAATATPQELQLIDLTKSPGTSTGLLAAGTGLTVSVVKGSLTSGAQTTPGDGLANIGYISAAGIPLGAVSIAGDLGRIDAGTASAPTGLASLKVHSMGVADISVAQQATGASLSSTITGILGSLTVTGDVKGEHLEVVNGTKIVGGKTVTSAFGNIGSILIGGSLKGNPTVAASSDSSGFINAAGDIGNVTIGTLATDGIAGGGGKFSGRVQAAGKMGSVTISGDVTGGGGEASGAIDAGTTMGAVTIKGSLTGAAGLNSGLVQAATLSSVTIGHRLTGGTNTGSGLVIASGNIGSVKIGTTAAADGIYGGSVMNTGLVQAGGNLGTATIIGDMVGGAGDFSAAIVSSHILTSVNVSHDVKGGGGANSGSIQAGSIGTATIGHSLIAGTKSNSGFLSSNGSTGAVFIGGDIDGTTAGAATGAGGVHSALNIASLTVVGAIKGGPNAQDGFVDGLASLGAVKVHDLIGGAGTGSGTITAGGALTSLTVLGNVTGGGLDAGSVFTGLDTALTGDIGVVKISGAVTGGTGDNSGTVSSGGKIAGVALGSAVPGATVLLKGGSGNYSGAVVSQGAIGPVTITGSVEGGGGKFSGAIVGQDRITQDAEFAGDLGAVTISGHVLGGSGADSGEIHADGNLVSVTTGALTSGTGPQSGSVRAGQGAVHAGLVGAVKVNGTLQGQIITEGRLASVTATGDATGAVIRSGNDIGSLSLKNVDNTSVSARGQAVQGATIDLAIGSISIAGHVAASHFLAGYNTAGQAVNADAQIGAVSVTGDWTASDLVAGVIANSASGFGTANELVSPGQNSPKIISQIASIVIGGNVSGTAAAGDSFGFTAQKIGSFKSHAGVLGFTAAPSEHFDLAADVTAWEVAPLAVG